MRLLKARGAHAVNVQRPQPAAPTNDTAVPHLSTELPDTLATAGLESHRTPTDILLDLSATFDKESSLRSTNQTGSFGDDLLTLSDPAEESDSSLASLPSRTRGEHLVKVYFDFFNLHLPLLHEPTFRQQLESQYSPEESSLSAERRSVAKFFVNMLFALGSLTLQQHDPAKYPTLISDQYYRTASAALETFDCLDRVESVQALLLRAQFAYYHPLRLGGWNIIGLAMRRAVELRMHEDPAADDMDYVQKDTIRRTFWVAYSLDRNVAVATGRPMSLSDGAITTKVSLHICTLSIFLEVSRAPII